MPDIPDAEITVPPTDIPKTLTVTIRQSAVVTSTNKPSPTQTNCPADVPALQATAAPTQTFTAAHPKAYIGLTIPPLPVGLEEIFGVPKWTGETPRIFTDYYFFTIRVGSTRMLWLAISYLTEDYSPKFDVYDSVRLPQLEDDYILIPWHCYRWGEIRDIFAVARMPEGWPSHDSLPVTDIVSAWIIDPSSNSLVPITSAGIECYPPIWESTPEELSPILHWYEDRNLPQTCED